MRVRTRALWQPKAGNSPEDYEDAFWPPRDATRTVPGMRVAVADGATETSFSGLWARMLVRAFCRGELQGWRPQQLAAVQRAWKKEAGSRPLAWYAEEKLRSGAFSSLLGLTLWAGQDGAPGMWDVQAVGDTCVFLVHDGRLSLAFPLERSQDFTNRPFLVSSHPIQAPLLRAHVRSVGGNWVRGDRFYVMTDALAAWFLARTEHGARPWDELDALGACGPTSFARWIAEIRRQRAIRNDDVTLLQVDLF